MDPILSLFTSQLPQQIIVLVSGVFVYDYILRGRRTESEKLVLSLQNEAKEYRQAQSERIILLENKVVRLTDKVDSLQSWKDGKTNKYIDDSADKMTQLSKTLDEVKHLIESRLVSNQINNVKM